MNIQELEDKHADIRFQPLNFDEFYEVKHTKLSVEFALEKVLKILNTDLNHRGSICIEIRYELKQYLDENI